jgi:hypothetical protein
MQGREPPLTRRQECAILALLRQPTLEDAARQAGIPPRRLWRWIHQDDFQQAYRQARHAAVSQAMGQLQQVCSEAVVTLHTVMTHPTARESARVSAARAVLELALRPWNWRISRPGCTSWSSDWLSEREDHSVSPRAKRLRRLELTFLSQEAEAFGRWLSGLSVPQRTAVFTRILGELVRAELAPPLPDPLWEAPLSVRHAYLAKLGPMMARDRLAVRQIIRQIWRTAAAGSPPEIRASAG